MEQSLTNMRYVRTLLERHGFHFSKKLGQNFLINPDVCPRIAEMGNAKPEHGILEIGTGIGTLTAELAKRAEKVTAVEVMHGCSRFWKKPLDSMKTCISFIRTF